MSQKDLTQFLEAVREDSSLQEKLRQSDSEPVALAATAGYSITLEEWHQHLSNLSDEDLENVAGGWGGGMTNLQTQPGWCPQNQ
jgi:predicted ribosomally synthesized peptide with nif11-like leader